MKNDNFMGMMNLTSTSDPKIFTRLRLVTDSVPAEFFSTTNEKTTIQFSSLISPEITSKVGKKSKIGFCDATRATLKDEKDAASAGNFGRYLKVGITDVFVGNLGFADTQKPLDNWNPQNMNDAANNQPPMRIEFALFAPAGQYGTSNRLRISLAYADGADSAKWYKSYLLNLSGYLRKLGVNFTIANDI